MRTSTPVIRIKSIIAIELNKEQAAAFRRVVKKHRTTPDKYVVTLLLSDLEGEDRKYGTAQLARSLGLPDTMTLAQVRKTLNAKTPRAA